MARRYEFGKTWWGKEWVKALENIDRDTNRLPRGRSYARNGHVVSISVSSDAVITAKVQGTRSQAYKEEIRLKLFGPEEIRVLQNIIELRPDLASQLLIGHLPAELNDILIERGVDLFPRSWGEIDAYCSCPDWANPCKHLAAVYYIMAQEIDKDPFLLFKMHGISKDRLMDMAKIGDTKETENIFVDENMISNVEKIEEPKMFEERQDVSKIVKLLDDDPAFYPNGNFKRTFKDFYKKIVMSLDEINQKLEEERHVYLKNSSFQILYSLKKPVVKIKGDTSSLPFARKKVDFSIFYEFMKNLPLFEDENDSQSVRFFKKIFSFSYVLIKNRLIFPKAVKIDKNDAFLIKYYPFSHNDFVREYINYLDSIAPKDVVINEYGKMLKRELVSEYVLSLFLSEYVKQMNFGTDDKISRTFFKGALYDVKKFEDRQTFTSVSNWLELFQIQKKDHSVIVTVKKLKEDDFSFQLNIQNNRNPLDIPMNFRDFMSSRNSEIGKETIMRQLGVIAKYSPLVAKASKNGKIEHLKLDDLNDFILNTSHVLNLLGVKILLPKELKNVLKPVMSLNLSLRDSGWKKEFLSVKEILTFKWVVKVGKEELSLDELSKLSMKSRGIVSLRDKYVFIDPNDLKHMLENVKNGSFSLSTQEALQAVLTGEYQGMKLNFSREVKEFLKDFKSIRKVRVPRKLNAKLRSYQQRGFQWLYTYSERGFGVCLADDMGLGKTIQTIAVILKEKEMNVLKKPALIVCPTTLLGNWQREIEKFAPVLKTKIYHGPSRKLEIDKVDVILTTYGVVRSDIKKLHELEWSHIIIDEAQNIKNPSTSQTRSVKALKANSKIALTGTPMENRILELWSIFDFLMPKYLGSKEEFLKKYAIPIEKYGDTRATQRLKDITAPFLMRRLKTDKTIIKDLPEKIIVNEYVYLKPEQASLYKSIVENESSKLSSFENKDIKRKGMIFRLLTSLKQVCNHPVHYIKSGNPSPSESGKTERTIEILKDVMENDEKTVVFTQYREMGKLLAEIFSKTLKIDPLFFHGGLNRKKRETMVKEFQEKHKYPIMIITIKAGGTGLNLTSANHVIHYDLWWNPAVENQGTDRTFRIGQKKNVIVHRLISVGTLEEKIDKLLQKKQNLANSIISVGEKWITELSNEELIDLFKLEV